MLAIRVVFVVLWSCAFACGQEGRYVDPGGRFSFHHPAAWTVRTTPAGIVATSGDGIATFAVVPASPREGMALGDVADGFEQVLRQGRPDLAVEVVADGPVRLGGRAAHRRVLQVGGGDAAVRLEVHVLRGPHAVLTASASCPVVWYGRYEDACAAMLSSLAAGAAAPRRPSDGGVVEKLRALEAARDAGILTADEYAQKKAELDAQLEASRPDPELERKLEALDAARDAGVLDEAEHARKRAELFGAVEEPEAADAPAAQEGKKGEIYRHPIGFSFWRPDGWKVQEQDDFLQLVPPDPAMAEGGPLELYFILGDTVEDAGITRPDDPQVVRYLDEHVRSIVASLERTGAPTPVPTARGEGTSIDWTCRTPDGRDLLARCYVAIVQRNGVALLALGLPDKIARREADLRAMFASFGFGEGAKDPALVGSWVLVSTTAVSNDSPFETDWSRARAVGETRSRITLGADGRFERVDDWHMIAIAGDVSIEDQQRDVERGEWCAGNGTLYLVSEDETWRDYGYRVERTAGGARLRLVAGNRGEIWEPAR